jgi:hypothetical protein
LSRGGKGEFGKKEAIPLPFFCRDGTPKVSGIKLLHHKSFVIPSQQKDLFRMFQFQSQKILDILSGITSPIHIVSQKDDAIRFFKVSLDNLLAGIQISVCISYKNNLAL